MHHYFLMEVKDTLISFAVIALIVFGAVTLFKKDTYVGFYYPFADNLSVYTRSEEFETLQQCRDWVDSLVGVPGVYDYECGKNCDFSGGEPYICEETLR